MVEIDGYMVIGLLELVLSSDAYKVERQKVGTVKC